MPTKFIYRKRKIAYLQKWLDATGRKQADVMRAAGVNKSTVSNWISDPTRQTMDVLSVFADVCGVEIADLFYVPGSRPTMAELRAARDTLNKVTD